MWISSTGLRTEVRIEQYIRVLGQFWNVPPTDCFTTDDEILQISWLFRKFHRMYWYFFLFRVARNCWRCPYTIRSIPKVVTEPSLKYLANVSMGRLWKTTSILIDILNENKNQNSLVRRCVNKFARGCPVTRRRMGAFNLFYHARLRRRGIHNARPQVSKNIGDSCPRYWQRWGISLLLFIIVNWYFQIS